MTEANTEESFRKGFKSLYDTTSDTVLSYEGKPLPAWLNDWSVIRVGGAQFEVGEQSYNHFFDGLAMLFAFRIEDGKVRYTNKFLQSKDYVISNKRGEISFTEFGTAPHRGVLARLKSEFNIASMFGSNCSVNVIPGEDGWVAIYDWPAPMGFDPTTLETIGAAPYDDKLVMLITSPHPLFDPARQEWINFGVGVSGEGLGYPVFRQAKGSSTRELITTVDRLTPSYMHSFALTENFVILTEHPYKAVWSKMATMGLRDAPLVDNFAWKDDEPTTFFVVDRVLGRVVAEIEAKTFLTLHHVQAWEDEGLVHVELATYPDDSVIQDLYFDKIMSPQGGNILAGNYRRYTLDLAAQSCTWEEVTSQPLEMPRTHPDWNYVRKRFVYGVSKIRHDDFYDCLVKVDSETGATTVWSESGVYANEPIFVPEPNGATEDAGAVITIVFDSTVSRAYLLVLDAHTFEEIGRADTGQCIPFGLHGMAQQDVSAR